MRLESTRMRMRYDTRAALLRSCLNSAALFLILVFGPGASVRLICQAAYTPVVVHDGGTITGKVRLEGSSTKSDQMMRSEEHTSELQSRLHLVCRLLL